MKRYLAILFVSLTWYSSAVAQWSWRPDSATIVCDAFFGDKRYPMIVNDNYDGGIISWQDSRSSNNPAYYGQRLTASGMKLWLADGVNLCDTAMIHQSFVCADGAGGMFLITDNSTLLPIIWTHVQRVDSNGATVWGNKGVQFSHVQSSYRWIGASGCRDGNSGIIVPYCDSISVGSVFKRGVFVHRIDSLGSFCWGARGTLLDTAQSSADVWTAEGPDKSAFIVYQRQYAGGMYAQRIDRSGKLLWKSGSVQLGSHGWNLQQLPIVRSTEDGGAIVLWNNSLYPLPNQFEYYVQKVDSSGNVQWGPDGLFLFKDAFILKAQYFTTDGSGGAVYSFLDIRQTGGTSDTVLVVQHIDKNGISSWPAPGIDICTVPGRIQSPAIVSDQQGGAIVAWMQYRLPSNNFSIYAQCVSAAGQPLWKPDGILVATSTSTSDPPQMIPDNHHGAIITWKSVAGVAPNTYRVIYASRIDSNGVVMPVEISSFTARLQGSAIKLVWKTSTETNNSGFDVQRAETEAGPWRDVAFVPDAGSTTAVQSYSYSDPLIPALRALPTLYYRLRQRDFDGTEHVTSPVEVAIGAPFTTALYESYPNPVVKETTIPFSLQTGGRVALKLYDVLGREAATVFEGDAGAGMNIRTFDASRLHSGVYSLYLEAGGGRFAKTLINRK